MTELGHFALCLAWLLTLYGMAAGVWAGRTHSAKIAESAANATVLVMFSSAVAIFSLGSAFLTNDYTLQYVWRFSNRDMDPVYKISAIWGGMDGSMLLWAFMLSLGSGIVALRFHEYPRRLIPWVLAVANSSLCFFLTVVVFVTNPFRYIKADFIPPDGNGLNPLLQNPLMAIHPPLLYLGFTTFAIPYAFCLGALLAGDSSNDWIRSTRRWTLLAWGFLTAGIALGGHWAYVELGWGGFWAWDPVENSSFLPWLTGTAFLHSVMVQERKSMLKFWNVWLVVLTYALTVFGTFLTRSGVVQSVHAFASTDVGWVFLLYLGLIFGGTLFLSFLRRRELKPERHIESLLSREAAFLINNLIFLSICFATLWGVMFPVISEAVTGVKQAVGIPFFNTVNVPLFLLMLFMMGVGPLIAWRKASLTQISRVFTLPFCSALGMACLLVYAGVTRFYPVLSYALCTFVLMTIFGEIHRGIAQQRLSAAEKGTLPARTAKLFRRHSSRYAGYLVHLGAVVAIVGVTASMAHKVEKEFSLEPGEKYEIGRFQLQLDAVQEVEKRNYTALAANVSVRSRKDGSLLGVLAPELRSYTRNKESTTEVALRMSLREDLYLVVAGLDESGERVTFKLFINPLQVWLWIGVILMLAGTLALLVPLRVPVRELNAEALHSSEKAV